MNINYKEILSSKISSDQIGHFYILNPTRALEDESLLMNWSLDLLAQVLSDDRKKFSAESVLNHEDLLIIQKSDKEPGSYKLSDFNEMFSFLNYKAGRFERKFIVIDACHKFSITVANKLLKTLEEPPIKCTIFLLNPKKVSALETIKSRAITLSIPFSYSQSDQSFMHDIIDEMNQGLTLDEFILKFKGSRSNEKELFKALNSWFLDSLSNNPNNSKLSWGLDEINKQAVIDDTYNAPALNRMHKVYFLLKELL